MGRLTTAVVVLFVLFLAVDLVVANALVAVDRTVLNPAFVTGTLEEEDAYGAAEPIVIDALPLEELEAAENGSGATDGESPPLPVDPRAVAAAAVDADYLRSQVEPNVEATYAYLHGNAGELQLAIDLEPAKAAIADAVEAELADASPTELFGTVGGDEGDLAFETRGMTIELATVARMAEAESTFHAEREAFRRTIRDRVIAAAVDEAIERATDDERLALVIEDYDPDAYTEAEKDQLVRDDDAAIREALRDRLLAEDDGEIAAAVDDRLAESRDAIRANVSSAMDDALGDLDPAVAEPVRELVLVAVDGYVADVSHDRFSAEFDAAAADLAAGVATMVEGELDEQVPDRLDLDGQLDPGARQGLEQARRAVGLVDLLSVVLPLVGLALVGAIFLLTRSVAVTAIGAGIGLVVGGLPALVVASVLPGRLEALLADSGAPQGVVELGLAITGQVATAVTLQSTAVVGVGLVALAAGLALHLGLVDLPASDHED